MTFLFLILGISAALFVTVLFHAFLEPSGKAYCLISVMSLFLAVEWASAQTSNIRALFMVAELLAVLILALYSLLNKNNIDRRNGHVLFCLLGGLVACNFLACIATYGDFFIFLWSTYDSCKYFAVAFALMAMNLSRKDIKAVVAFISLLILVCFLISACQFAGLESLFDPFRGRYGIVIRSGSYRAIGFFPYPIELGNWATMMFALVYGFNRAYFKSKVLDCISFLCLLTAAFSGTRTALIAILIVYVLSNFGSFKKGAKIAVVVFAAIGCIASFLPLDEIISRLSLDVTTELPRQYYFVKGLEVWSGHPLFGIGFGTFGAMRYRDLTQDYIFNFYNIHKFDSAGLASTDSFYSEVIPEYGIIGIFLLLTLAYMGFCAIRKKGSNAKAAFPVLLAALVLAINSSTAFTSAHVGFYFWLALGLLFSSTHQSISGSRSLDNGALSE